MPIPAFSCQFPPILVCSSLFQLFPAYSSPFQYSSLFQHILTYSSLFQPVPAISSLFQPIPSYSLLFHTKSQSPISNPKSPISNLKCPNVHFIANWTFCLLVLYLFSLFTLVFVLTGCCICPKWILCFHIVRLSMNGARGPEGFPNGSGYISSYIPT